LPLHVIGPCADRSNATPGLLQLADTVLAFALQFALALSSFGGR
jgi:hypothetical protein